MVSNVTSLTNNGLRDWLVQRISAIILAVYTIFLLVFFVRHPNLRFSEWQGLFDSLAMRVFSLVALFALALHAWIGIWTVTTDYLKGISLRMIVHFIVAITLFGCFVWGIEILWGI